MFQCGPPGNTASPLHMQLWQCQTQTQQTPIAPSRLGGKTEKKTGAREGMPPRSGSYQELRAASCSCSIDTCSQSQAHKLLLSVGNAGRMEVAAFKRWYRVHQCLAM